MAENTGGKEVQGKTGAPAGAKKQKKSFGKAFLTFLMMGGWLLILIVILGIVIAVSILTAGPKPA